MAAGLKRNEKCIYIVDEATKDEVYYGFKKAGTDIKKNAISGQFVFLAGNESYFKDGYFEPERMLALIKKAEQQAFADGYSGLRLAEEMSGIFTRIQWSAIPMEYESKLNYLIENSKTLALCQYDETRVAGEILLDVIHTHPQVIIYGKAHANPYYLQPDMFLIKPRPEGIASAYETLRDYLIADTSLE